MAWTDDSGPTRSRDELLDHVVRRGTALRRRRQLLTGAVAGLAAVTLGISLVALVSRDTSSNTDILTASGAGTSSTAALHGAAAAVDAVPDSTTTTTAPAPVVTSVVPRPSSSPTTAGPAPATTPTTAAPPATAAPTVPATTTTTISNCTVADLTAASTTDKATYAAGETVKVSGTIRNTSSRPCLYGFSFTATFKDATGKTVSLTVASHGDYFNGPPVFNPGQTYDASHQWNQQICVPETGACAQAPAGTYAGVITWRIGPATIDAPAVFKVA